MGFRTTFLCFVVLILITISLAIWLVNLFRHTYIITPGPAPVSPLRGIMAVALPCVMAYGGLKKRSLNISGAVIGWVVGFVMIMASYSFFIALFMFFVLGSKVTKYKSAQKRTMEANFQEGGQRNWIQVICNGGIATLFALLYLNDNGCGEQAVDFSSNFLTSSWSMAVLGSLASSNGDTFASEIGLVWNLRSKPWLITSFQRVPHGTNGGISPVGTFASLIGGFIVGLAYYIVQICFVDDLNIAPPQHLIIWLGAFAGLFGSIVDSVLGATLQFSGVDKKSGCVVDQPGPGVEKICGRYVLDNHAVNLFTSLAMALITPNVAFYLYGLYQ